MIKLINLLELNVNKSKITFIPKEQIYVWEYIGSEKLKEYIPNIGQLLSGTLIFNKYIFLLSPKDENGMYNVCESKYFIKKEQDV